MIDVFPATRRLRPSAWFRAALSALLVGVASVAVARPPDLAGMAVVGVRDLRARLEVTRVDGAALRSVSPDLATLFGLKAIDITYQEPARFRAEARVGLLITNGSSLYYRVPQLGIKRKTDLGSALHRRHSLLDLGLLTEAKLAEMEGRYLRAEAVHGVDAYVFDLRYRADQEVRYTVWIDPVRRVALRRDWFDRAGKLKGSFEYQDVREAAPGIFVPRRIEVRTATGAAAGVAVYRDVVVNSAPDAALFEIPADTPARPGG